MTQLRSLSRRSSRSPPGFSIATCCFIISLCSIICVDGRTSAYVEAQRLALTALASGDSPTTTGPNESTRRVATQLMLDASSSLNNRRLLQQLLANKVNIAANLLNAGVGSGCVSDVVRLLTELLLAKPWTLPYADSMAKPQPGLLNGATTWLGSFDQCLAAGSNGTTPGNNRPTGFSGSYCLMKLVLLAGGNGSATPLLTVGTCWPDSCSMWDAVNVTSHLIRELLHIPTVAAAPAAYECTSADRRSPLTAGAIAMIVLLGIIGFCLAAGTAVDLYEASRTRSAAARAVAVASATAAAAAATVLDAPDTTNLDSSEAGGDEEALIAATLISPDNAGRSGPRYLGVLRSILLCFSMRANAAKLLSQSQPDTHLTCVHGIRFLSMAWVILGHTFVLGLMSVSNLGQLVPRWLNNWTFQAILNATVSVDTFFVLSGLLATYLFLREVDLRGGQLKRINWLRFYLHRYWRLTAPYMILLGVYATLAGYLYDGPRYPRDGFDPNCETRWWQNLLYINNMYNMGDTCMAWSWYLANDMQFYVISPLFLVPMVLKPVLGAAVTALALVASVTAVGVHSSLTGQSVMSPLDSSAEAQAAYQRPWFRIGPYLVGCLAGLLAHRALTWRARHRRSLRLHWAMRLAGWLTAAGLCLSVLYGLFDVERGHIKLSQPVTSLYNCTFRLAWSLGVAWVVLACATGNGGWVAELLSAGWFAPLSRLSYCAYLIHPAMMYAVEAARRDTVHWNAWSPAVNFLAYLAASYVAAFGASLALESPLIALERLATGGRQ